MLPSSIAEIAEVIGRESALWLVANSPMRITKRGGKNITIYVPKRVSPSHRLVAILGLEKAKQLVAAFPGETLKTVPLDFLARQRRDAQITRLLALGWPVRAVAAAMGVSQQHVRMVRQ